jgi:SET domain-containing protein
MSYQTEPVTMRFDRRLVLRKSPIHGTGTFAIGDIRAGETLIWVAGGLVLTAKDRREGTIQLDAEMYNEERLPDDLVIVTPKSFHYYINHACEPNAVDQSKNPTWTHYIALRDIRANEEITADYYVYGEGKLAACACKSPRCRWAG